MALVVTCRSCGSWYRLNEALLEDAKGARIRCRKCGDSFVVRKPSAPPVPPAQAAGPGIPPPRPETEPPPLIRPVPPPPPPEGKGTRPGEDAVAAPPPGEERKRSLLEEALLPSSDADAGPNPFGKYTTRDIGVPRPAGKGAIRRLPLARPVYLAAGLAVLLIAGGAFYLGYVKHGKVTLGAFFPWGGSANPGSAGGSPILDIQDLKWRLEKRTTGESLYIIKGTVANVGSGSSGGIRIRATLLGKDNQAIMENESFAGNLIDEMLLPHMSQVRIEGFLGMRYGEGNVNRDIPAGRSLPFMVVLFDPPEAVESFTVKAIDVGHAEKSQPPDGQGRESQASSQKTIRAN